MRYRSATAGSHSRQSRTHPHPTFSTHTVYLSSCLAFSHWAAAAAQPRARAGTHKRTANRQREPSGPVTAAVADLEPGH